MEQLAFERWVISIDSIGTANAYTKIPHGEAKSCGCRDCSNWIEQRSVVFPNRFIQLLDSLGIDSAKETEISEFEGGTVNAQENLYVGEYLFIGKIESGPDCFIEEPDGKGATHWLQPIFGDLQIGFSSNLHWAMGREYIPELFPRNITSVLVFRTHALRGSTYA